jgi:hypothetical protein
VTNTNNALTPTDPQDFLW